MHELALAERILEPALACAAEHGAVRVTRLTVRAGALQQIVPESLAMCFQAVAEGTPAAGAELVVETVPVTARCRRCGNDFGVEDFIFICPDCGVADVATTGGTELVLADLELEACESTSSITS